MGRTLCFFGGYGPQYWLNIRTADIEGKCDGITVCSLDDEGKLVKLSDIHGIDSPATLAVSPDGKFLYAANELNNFKDLGYGGGISAFSFDDKSNKLNLLNQVSAAGSCTAYIAIDKYGRYLFVANHGSYYYVSRYEIDDFGHVTPFVLRDEGCVCVYRIMSDGSVGALVDRLVLDGRGHDPIVHGVSHPHCVVIDENDDVIIPDKGGDQIYYCHFSRENEKLAVRSVFNSGDGSSPRHAVFIKGTPYIAVTNEFDAHLTIYRIDRANGCLVPTAKVDTYDPDIPQECDLVDTARPWAIDVRIHLNGKFVYVDNTQNIICLFYLNEQGGIELIENTPVENAGMVRGMGISPDGRYLIITGVSGEKADVFAINQHSGHLSHVSSIELPTPTAVAFKVYGGRDD